MDDIRVSSLRAVALGVSDLEASLAFYRDVWGLREVAREAGIAYLRGTGADHHILELGRELGRQPRPGLLRAVFGAPGRDAVAGLHQRAVACGAEIVASPAPLPVVSGGGFGFSLKTPAGNVLTISADVARHAPETDDPSRPIRLSHLVLNAADEAGERAFFLDVLGFRLSDSTDRMDFLRCSADHHSIALAQAERGSINHIAFELADIDGLMRGAGRLKKAGYQVEWGVGRHGPGDNVFCYFVDPNGFAVEYTTGMQQIALDDDTYQPHDAAYWREFQPRPCRWGMAMSPSELMIRAMSGDLVAGRS